MSSLSQENDIFYLLVFWINLHDISGERTYWIYLSSYDELIFIYFHFDDLIIDSGIIKIASEQKEYQYSSDNIII